MLARLRSSMLLSDRYVEYERLLEILASHGFVGLTVREVSRFLQEGRSLPGRRVLLRHDIDTDPGYVDQWLAAERRFGFPASYYFRLRTLDIPAMGKVEAGGSEASYHFEELASVIRRRGLNNRPITDEIIAEASDDFEKNFTALQRKCEWPLRTVASHGDFVNRKIGMTNCIVIADRERRERLGLWAEAYDPDIQAAFGAKFSDRMGGGWRSGAGIDNPEKAISSGSDSLSILTHPRHWRANLAGNFREDMDRVLSGVLFDLGLPAGAMVDYVNQRWRLTVSMSHDANP